MYSLRLAEHLNVRYLRLRRRLAGKVEGRGIVVFTKHGLGNFVMLMPCLKALAEQFDVTVFNKSNIISAILLRHFPTIRVFSDLDFSECFEHAIFPFGGTTKEFVQKSLKFPNIIGHSFRGNKWNSFYDVKIEMDIDEFNGEVKANNKIAEYFGFKAGDLFFDCDHKEIRGLASRYIVIQPVSSADERKNYDFRDIIKEFGGQVIIIGSENERADCEKLATESKILNLCGQLTLFELAGLLTRAEHCYCNEGGISHVARAVNAKTTVFFNPSITENRVMHDRVEYRSFHNIGE